jgi:multiple sugar transport system ATP-binding protein
MAQVRLDKVTKIYDGNVLAVDEFTLDIKDKEFLVLVGPSGCGKSTTLRMVAGLEEISGGDLYIDDRRVNDVAPKDRDIAMVFQNYALYPHMSVFDNMSFALRLRKVSKAKIKEQVEAAADILGIHELLQRKPRQLSGGQRQRVAMGRAIVRDPKVFLFDEPLSNLDAKLRVQMRVELGRLHARLQTTIIYVTHDQVEAMTLADRIVVMKDGIVQQVGTPMELFHTPTNAFVGGFIGSPSMNFLTAEVSSKGDRIHLTGPEFDFELDDARGAAVKQSGDTKILFGVRPLHIVPGEEGQAQFSARVDVIEPMGVESYYHFQVGEDAFVGRSEGGARCKVGDTVTFGVDYEGLHLFSADGTKRLNA